ncbi:MAG: glycosyltransferase family 2 protein [Ignavibacteriaceae bacterium]|nr:glycosyltransferase family 2 protein [Ignavibacteriaceae bacterium]
MINISSIVIANNEGSNIRRCIESQLSCIDEIVILIDEKSTDKTTEIANSYSKVKSAIVKWKGYSETKKEAISLTSNDWVFWIDADEAFSKKLNEELLNFKNSVPTYFAYSVPRKAYFLGKWIKHCGWYPGRVIRLFNKNHASFNSNNVHENLNVNGKIGQLVNDLEHYTDPSVSHYFIKFNTYTSLAARDLQKNGKRFHLSDLIIRPIVIFMKMYIIKLGFLDGIQGFILSIFSTAYVFTKYSKFWELKRKESL